MTNKPTSEQMLAQGVRHSVDKFSQYHLYDDAYSAAYLEWMQADYEQYGPTDTYAYSVGRRCAAKVVRQELQQGLTGLAGQAVYPTIAEDHYPAPTGEEEPSKDYTELTQRLIAATTALSAANLSETEERLVKQHYLQGIDMADLAAVEGVHRRTISRTIDRAIDKIKAEL